MYITKNMIDLNKFAIDLVKKANINIPKGHEDTVIEHLMPSLEEFLNLNLATLLNDKDREIMKKLLEITPETFDGYIFFKDRIKNIDKEIDKVLVEFKEMFLNNKKNN